MTQLKAYDLYQTPTGITADTSKYKHGTPIIRVAAVSIKQAYYLAGNNIWIDENSTRAIRHMDIAESGHWEHSWGWRRLLPVFLTRKRTRTSSHPLQRSCATDALNHFTPKKHGISHSPRTWPLIQVLDRQSSLIASRHHY